LTANPGKDMRSHLIEAFNYWLKVPQKELGIIAHVVSMLHNASLMYVFSSSLSYASWS
jgi:geranylgeranyl diphosphate synthase type 3